MNFLKDPSFTQDEEKEKFDFLSQLAQEEISKHNREIEQMTTMDLARGVCYKLTDLQAAAVRAAYREDFEDMEPYQRKEVYDLLQFVTTHRHVKETLLKLRNKGPLEDGDIPSKSARDELVDFGACAHILVNGVDGFNACTHYGRILAKVFENLDSNG